ncbi:pyruvate, phosphate dikinase [Listeria ilorinensis]|uniref:pyruvate, phosphate dikinase n=1 Tax=Listeria ilorinensis TaxID=2867439 RepID=UPI001EF49900|nr:pyruvate, phosphate dikinase [Listeria ilorinensis]
MRKFVYRFDEGRKEMKFLLGGKGANLAEMTRIGLPVPPGFTISTDACKDYNEHHGHLSEDILREVMLHLAHLEKASGKRFGSTENPLLVSVRSGAPVSMPGMMDTILNLGLNEKSVQGMIHATGDARSSLDSYRRFIQMFGDVVFGIPSYHFEQALVAIKKEAGCQSDTDLQPTDLEKLIERYLDIFLTESGRDFPQDPKEQLMLAITAVFDSWMNPRAVIYRRLHEIDASYGTAVNIQTMVFGNTGETSGTGIAFTRNPSTGEKEVFGEFLLNAQGEDVVAGIRTPVELSQLRTQMPEVYEELMTTCALLEDHYQDMQDIEFTIEKEQLYILQTRNGKRTTKAAIQVAVDLVHEGKISTEEAIMRIAPNELDQLLHPAFHVDALASSSVLATGLPASPGAATGMIYFDAASAVKAAEMGSKVILVRSETSPEDIEGMAKSEAILTARGGMTSHAAVVARGMGKCCVVGCADILIDEQEKAIRTKSGHILHEGDQISLDGTTGQVYGEELPLTEAELFPAFDEWMEWVNEAKRLHIRVNADTPADLQTALHFGAEGIGLCRTEHMFFHEERIPFVRQMIIAENIREREDALEKLKQMQKEDFCALFRIADGRPINIRLLDPPLHEFLPKETGEIEKLSQASGKTVTEIRRRLTELAETNPMLGHRGCRLAVTYPEIYKMQAEAIMESAMEIHDEGIPVQPEIMIPLVATQAELALIKNEIKTTIQQIFEKERLILPFDIGTMIETPRACIVADQIAQDAQFFSFGTNDLTQLTFGFSRDDAGKFLPSYEKLALISRDPFVSIDQDGVGALVELGTVRGRMTQPNIKIGVCGEHGGDPASIHFFHKIGLHYVSCSPFRVPIARLAAAQASLLEHRSMETV